MKVCCEHCGRYLFTAVSTTIIAQHPCSGCGAKSNHKIIFPEDCTEAQLHFRHTTEETPPKKLKAV